MVSEVDVVDKARALAHSFLAAHAAELLALVGGDRDLLTAALRLLYDHRGQGSEMQRVTDEAAAALLTTAYLTLPFRAWQPRLGGEGE
jgi:hypothetical protein